MGGNAATTSPERAGSSAGLGPLRILLVDDHALFAEGLSLLLQQLDTEVLVTRAESCEEALALLERSSDPRPDLVLFDLTLPGAEQLEAFRLLGAAAPGVPLVAVSADERPKVISELLRAGARGYIPKSTSSVVLEQALRLVLAGGTYVPEGLVSPLTLSSDAMGITPREQEVLLLVARGEGNRAIAEKLGMAESTVRVHVTSILRRLGVRSRAAAMESAVVKELLGQE